MKRILVIEDNPANLKLVRDLLTREGHQVVTATSADDGLPLALAQPPDLIIMDIQLPGIDGLAATRRLKAESTTRAVPVLALTAYAMQGDEERILAAGCDRYLTKPIRYKEFLTLIRAMLAP